MLLRDSKLEKKKYFNQNNHYAIRKLTVGAASVLLGTMFFLNEKQVVKADAVAPSTAIAADKASQQNSAQQADQQPKPEQQAMVAHNVNLKWVDADHDNQTMTDQEQDDFKKGHNLGIDGSFELDAQDLIPKEEITIAQVAYSSSTGHYLDSMENSANKNISYNNSLLGRIRYTGKALVFRVDDNFKVGSLKGRVNINVNNLGVIWLNDHTDFSHLGVTATKPYWLQIQLQTADTGQTIAQTTIHYSLKEYEHEFHYPLSYVDKWIGADERDFQLVTDFVSKDQIDNLLKHDGKDLDNSLKIPQNVSYYLQVTPIGNSEVTSLSANVRRNISTFNEAHTAFNNIMVSRDQLQLIREKDGLSLKELDALPFTDSIAWSKQANGQVLVVVHYAPADHKINDGDWQQVSQSDPVLNLLADNKENALQGVKNFYTGALAGVDPYNVISLNIPIVAGEDNTFKVAKVNADGEIIKSLILGQKTADSSVQEQTQINVHFINSSNSSELRSIESFTGWPKNAAGHQYQQLLLTKDLRPDIAGFHYRRTADQSKFNGKDKFTFKHLLVNRGQDIVLDYPTEGQDPVDYYFLLDPNDSNQQQTDDLVIDEKPLLNIIRYLDEKGQVIKTDHATGKEGDPIKITIPQGYTLKDRSQLFLKLTKTGLQTVQLLKQRFDKHDDFVIIKPNADDHQNNELPVKPVKPHQPADITNKANKSDKTNKLINNKNKKKRQAYLVTTEEKQLVVQSSKHKEGQMIKLANKTLPATGIKPESGLNLLLGLSSMMSAIAMAFFDFLKKQRK